MARKNNAQKIRVTMAESKSGTHRIGSTPKGKISAGAKQKALDEMLKGMRGGGKKEISGK